MVDRGPGRYTFVTYSALYYPIAGLVGIKPLVAGCAVASVAAFRRLTERRWGAAARWSNRSMAVVLPCFVLTGALPFLLGATLSLLALTAMEPATGAGCIASGCSRSS